MITRITGWLAIVFAIASFVMNNSSGGNISSYGGMVSFCLLIGAGGGALLQRKKWGWWLLLIISSLALVLCGITLFLLGAILLAIPLAMWTILVILLALAPPSRWETPSLPEAQPTELLVKKE